VKHQSGPIGWQADSAKLASGAFPILPGPPFNRGQRFGEIARRQFVPAASREQVADVGKQQRTYTLRVQIRYS
jgi:hypothetical protein